MSDKLPKGPDRLTKADRRLLESDFEEERGDKNFNKREFNQWLAGDHLQPKMPTMTQTEVIAVEDERRSRKEEELKLERILTNPDTRIIYIHANGGYKEDQIILGYGNGHESEKLDITMSGFVDLFNKGQRSNATSFPRSVDLSTKELFLQTLRENEFNDKPFEGNKLRVIYPIDMHHKPERTDRVVDRPDVKLKVENFFRWWAKNQDNLKLITVGHDGNDLKTIGLKFSYEDYDDVVVLPFDVFKGLTEGTMLGGQNGLLNPNTDKDTAKDVLRSLKIDGVMINQKASVHFRDLRK